MGLLRESLEGVIKYSPEGVPKSLLRGLAKALLRGFPEGVINPIKFGANPALTRNSYCYSLFGAGCAAAVLFDCENKMFSPTYLFNVKSLRCLLTQ